MYLNVTEIESALAALHAACSATSELVESPAPHARWAHQRAAGRSSAAPSSSNVDDGLLLGGVHAREWMPPDALVSLAADLLEAHADGTGLGYGGASYSASEVHRILQTLNLFFFACAFNPDGRAHAQALHPGGARTGSPHRRA